MVLCVLLDLWIKERKKRIWDEKVKASFTPGFSDGSCAISVNFSAVTYEPPRGKTNNVVSDQVRHKPACTSTEKG